MIRLIVIGVPETSTDRCEDFPFLSFNFLAMTRMELVNVLIHRDTAGAMFIDMD
jgi:hypothetical protein